MKSPINLYQQEKNHTLKTLHTTLTSYPLILEKRKKVMACLGKPEVNCVSVGLFETARLLLLRFEDTFTAVLFISLKVTTCENYSQRKKQRNECNFSKPRRRNYQVYSNLIGTCNGTDRVPYCFHPGAELGSARGATAPQKFCHCPPKILSSQCHPQNFPLDVMPLH